MASDSVSPKISLASWSLNQDFEDAAQGMQMDEFRFLDVARKELDFEAVEFLYSHLSKPEGALHPEAKRLDRIQDTAEQLGVKVVCVAIHNNFVLRRPDPDISYVEQAIKTAERLEAPLLRINAGLTTFCAAAIDTFLANLQKVLPVARQANVALVLENQGGITLDPYNMFDIVLRARNTFGSEDAAPLMICLDLGNFTSEDCMQAVRLFGRSAGRDDGDSPSKAKREYIMQTARRLAVALGIEATDVLSIDLGDMRGLPAANGFIGHVHAKCYSRDPRRPPFRGLERDYSHILYQLFLGEYSGYFSIEYEGYEEWGHACRLEPELTAEQVRSVRRTNAWKSIKNMRALIDEEHDNFLNDRATGEKGR